MSYIITAIIIIIAFNYIKYINVSEMKGSKEKLSIYECGFSEFEEPRQKYYIKFYIIAIIFLIFDLETIIIYPLSIYISSLTTLNYLIIYYFFIVLSIGLGIEIKNKLLE